VKKLEKRMAERNIAMIITDAALDTMADIGFDPVFGARPLKRAIQQELETKVAKGILRGDFADMDETTIDSDGEGSVVIYKSGVRTVEEMTEPVYESMRVRISRREDELESLLGNLVHE